jgi:hypothetical protein
MKRASIYKDEKGYILFPSSRTKAGFYISTDPEIRIYNDEVENKLTNALIEVLKASTTGVSNPLFNKKLDDNKKLELKARCKKLNIKSLYSLNKKPFLMCLVKLENEIIIVEPQVHDLSMRGIGYTEKPYAIAQTALVLNKNEILKAIEKAFAECE